MESIEEKIKKDNAAKNINKKNYLWLIPIFIATVIITFYSNHTNKGNIAKQTMQKEFHVKNQANLDALFNDNIHTADNAYDKIIAEDKIPDETEITPQEDAVENQEIKTAKVDIAQKASPIEVVAQNEIKEPVNVALPVAKKEPEQPIVPIEKVKEEIPDTEVVIKEAPLTIVKEQTQKPQTIPLENKQITPQTNAEGIHQIRDPKVSFSLEKCYDLEPNNSNLTSQCIQNLTAFLEKHKTSSKFEVIGIFDLVDERNSAGSANTLAKERANEGKKLIKEVLGAKTQILAQSYTLKTELENRGLVIRAYN
ncbi:MAG: hypothetical protein ACNI3C_01025 [Candidatus Marinarcus sp.]|uniref:hypothetical protein n=1 Tax=Candidatus Marinarcus sp. TaxID=3100987 RepID=UPI003AFFC0F1